MIANDIGGFHTDAATPERKSLMQMKNLTSEEQQRLWKLDEPPTRRILLWGLDGIWLSTVAADALAVAVTALFLVGKRKKYRY